MIQVKKGVYGVGLWSENTSSANFKGENTGKYYGTSVLNLDVDLSKVNMNNTHVKDEKLLITLQTVRDYINPTEDIKLYLDGGKEGNPAETFVMHEDTWKAVAEKYTPKGTTDKKGLSFKFCKTLGEACKYIKLVNDTEKAIEVPALKFTSDGNKATVLLDGEWKYTTANIGMANVQEIRVIDSSTLTSEQVGLH